MNNFTFWIIANILVFLGFLGSLPLSFTPENFANGQFLPMIDFENALLFYYLGIIFFILSAPSLIYEEFHPNGSLLTAIISFLFVGYKPFNYSIDNDYKEIKIINPFHSNYFISYKYFPKIIKVITKDNRKLFLRWQKNQVEYLTYIRPDGMYLSNEHKKLTISFYTTLSHKLEKIDIDNIKKWKPYNTPAQWNWLFFKVYPLTAHNGS